MIVPATTDSIARAVVALKAGQVIGLPTETVYGLAADATNPSAVAAVFAAKGRPHFNPLIAHCASAGAALAHAVPDPRAQRLAEAFWPGPLTLVLPRADHSPICELACAGLATVALRVPRHPVALAVLTALDRPLAAPSANRSGRISPTTAADVLTELGDALALILDGGPCPVGLESTIIAVPPEGPCGLLRPGGLDRAAIEALVGPLAAPGPGIRAPGMLTSHYAPRAALRLDARPADGDVFLAFGPSYPADLANLSPTGDLTEAASRLYSLLRALDRQSPEVIAVAPIPGDGLGEAIRDRLARAAAPRP
jgi:L-threonylcarbamoyladenylate synthase